MCERRYIEGLQQTLTLAEVGHHGVARIAHERDVLVRPALEHAGPAVIQVSLFVVHKSSGGGGDGGGIDGSTTTNVVVSNNSGSGIGGCGGSNVAIQVVSDGSSTSTGSG